MNGFLSFFVGNDKNYSFSGENPETLDHESLTLVISQTKDLIGIYLRRYIQIYNPKYTFEEVVQSIEILTISDQAIGFSIRDPYTKREVKFGFGVSFLEDIQEETRSLVDKALGKKALGKNDIFEVNIGTLTPRIYGIIRSWLPHIEESQIVGASLIGGHQNGPRYGYLKVYFYTKTGGVWDECVPNIFRGEFFGTMHYNIHSVLDDRRHTMGRLLGRTSKYSDIPRKK